MNDIQGHIQSMLFHTATIDSHLVAREPFNKSDIRSFTNKLTEIGWMEPEFFQLRQDTGFKTFVSNMILQASSNASVIGPTHILLRGEPSSGKTTELRRIAQRVLNSSSAKQILPLYTELQYSKMKHTVKSTLWDDIASGCTNPEFEHLPGGQSLGAFVSLCNKEGHQPIIFIDTLDILLLQMDEDTTIAWSDFLHEATKSNVPIVWTCRPHEWNIFEPIINETVRSKIITIDLPILDKRDLEAFMITEQILERDIGGSGLVAWREWTKDLQANVPLFAHRSLLPSDDKRRLPNSFLSALSTMFHDYIHLDLVGKNPLDVLDGNLPTSHYYRSLTSAISDTLYQDYDLEKGDAETFFTIFEAFVQNSVRHNKTVLRLRFSTLDLRELLRGEGFEVLNLRAILNVTESHGLLRQNGLMFEFTHQLLFEEVLFKSEPLGDFIRFPSIQIRNISSGIDEISSSEFRENFDSLNHWIGGLLAFHPDVRVKQTNLPSSWQPWIEYAKRLDFEFAEASIMGSENAEKRTILQSHLSSSHSQALYLNGAPGTGKTFFCFYFLQHHLLKKREKLAWRYVTLSEPLVDHFEREWKQFKSGPEADKRLMVVDRTSDSTNRSLGGTSLEYLLSKFLVRLVRNPDTTPPTGARFGLLTFRRFKERLSEHYASLKTGQSAPATSDAWHDYRTLWHHSAGEKFTKDLDFKAIKNGKMALKEPDLKEFQKFTNERLKNWKIIEEASYLATLQLEAMSDEERSLWQHDVLMVDEIQDLSPPALTFLFCLNRRSFDSKSVLIAGDRFQTVNRSGFAWNEFTEGTFACLQHSGKWLNNEHFKRLEGLLFKNGGQVEIETLRTQYRNAPKITKFNDSMRAAFGVHYGAEFDDYDGGAQNLSEQVKQNDKFAQITLCICKTDEELTDITNRLQSIETDITQTSNVAVITPYDHQDENLFNGFRSFTVYDGESVKGLEFDGVVVLQPYELLSDEAASSIGLGSHQSQGFEESRIKKWFDSNTQEAEKMRLSFLGLYDNIRTRMNVVFSRPKFTLLVLLRDNLGTGPIEFKRDKLNSSRLFDIPNPGGVNPSWNDEIKFQTFHADSITNEDLHASLYLPEDIGDTSLESRVERAIQAEQMRDGASLKNIVTLWRNFIKNIEIQSKNLPYRSACLLSGSVDLANSSNSPPTVLYALRGGVLDPSKSITNYITSKDSACERVLYHLHRANKPNRNNSSRTNTLHYATYAALHKEIPALLHEALYEASRSQMIAQYPQILEALLWEFFEFELPILPEEGQEEFAISSEISLLLSEELVEKNKGVCIKMNQITFSDFYGRFSKENPEEVILEESRSFDRILLSILKAIEGEENSAFLDRCFNTIGRTKHLEIDEMNSSFWQLGAGLEQSDIHIALSGLSGFLSHKLTAGSTLVWQIENKARSSDTLSGIDVAESNLDAYALLNIRTFWQTASTKGILESIRKNQLLSSENRDAIKNQFIPIARVMLMEKESSFSRCLEHLVSIVQHLDTQQAKEIGRPLYFLTWYCRQKPAAGVSRALLMDWYNSQKVPKKYSSFVNLWWDEIVAEMGLKQLKSRVPRKELERIELLETFEPVLDLLELKAASDPQHRPRQRSLLQSVIDTCFECTPTSTQEIDFHTPVLLALQKLVMGDEKHSSLIDKFNLETTLTSRYTAKLTAMYGVVSLYSMNQEDIVMKNTAEFHSPSSTYISPPPLSIQELMFFKRFLDDINATSSLEFMEFYRSQSNAYVDSDDSSWWNIKKRTPYWYIEGGKISHWIRFVELNGILKYPATLTELKSWRPHPFLPLTLEEKTQEKPSNLKFLEEYSLKLRERSYQETISTMLTWLYTDLPGEETEDQIPVDGSIEPGMRSLLLRDYMSAYNQQHFLDWHLLFLLSQSVKPNEEVDDRSEHDLLSFNAVLDSMASAAATNLDILDVYSSDKDTLEIWIHGLEMITSNVQPGMLHQVSDFVAMLADPYVELLARYKKSTMNKFTLRGRGVRNGFFTDHTRLSESVIGKKGIIRKQYHRQMLREFITFLLKRGFEILGIEE